MGSGNAIMFYRKSAAEIYDMISELHTIIQNF